MSTEKRTFITLEEAFPCSYTRIADPKRGKLDILATNAGALDDASDMAEESRDCEEMVGDGT